jgi:uncharacterized protein YggE
MPFTRRYILAAAILIPLTATAQTPDPCATAPTTCATLVSTHATSRTRIPNTVVDISLSITVSEKDLPTAQHALADKSTTLLSYLRSQQVQRLSTGSVTFAPETRTAKNGPDRTVAYNGRSTISFRTLPDKAPGILGGALEQGATAITDTSFTPTEEEIAAARRSLEAAATEIAIGKANNVAQAAGLHVVSIRNITVDLADELTYAPRGGLTMYEVNGIGGANDKVQTEAGDATLSTTVNIEAAATH